MNRRRLLVVLVVVAWCSTGLAEPGTAAPAYSVTLTAAPTALETGEYTTLTTTADRDLTGTRYTTYLFDQTDPSWYRMCKVKSCSFSVTQSAPGTHTYIAYIARDRSDPRYPPMQVQATSDPASVTWTAVTFTVDLVADQTWLPPGATAGLTAETNRDVAGRGLSIQIFDLTSGERIALCAEGTSCNAFERELAPSTHTYQAFVAEAGDTPPPPNVHASSNILAVTWSPLPDPSRPPNVGGGDLTGTVSFAGSGVPQAGEDCTPTNFTFDGFSVSTWVSASGAAYAGPLSVSGFGGSDCEGASNGIGTITVSASGTGELGSLTCGPLGGGYTRVATDVTVVVTGDCRIGDFSAFLVTFVAKGEFVPTNNGGGLTAPVTEAAFAGAFTVVPA